MRQYLIYCTLFFLIIGCSDDSVIESPQPIPSEEFSPIISDIESGVYGDTHSLIVCSQGERLVENYFEGFNSDSLHYMYSVTKSVASMAVGIALDEGLIESLDTRLLDLFPEYEGSIDALDNRKNEITIEDVLTMSAGFQWDEWTYSYLDSRNDANQLIQDGDMIKAVLDLPMAHEPGSVYRYNSGLSIMLGGIIKQVSGQNIEEYLTEKLFRPLGISRWRWERGFSDLDNINSGWGLHLLPRDMEKLGRLFLNEGEWQGEMLIDADWVKASTANQISNYGYQWWISNDFYSARGWGGQMIIVYPSRDLVIVTTAGNFNGNPAGLRIADEVISILDQER